MRPKKALKPLAFGGHAERLVVELRTLCLLRLAAGRRDRPQEGTRLQHGGAVIVHESIDQGGLATSAATKDCDAEKLKLLRSRADLISCDAFVNDK